MRLAVCDLGSFSGLILIAEKRGRGVRAILEERHTVDLSYRPGTRVISRAGLERAASVLNRFRMLVAKHESERVIVVSTAALRDASNRKAVVRYLETQSGVRVGVLSARQEAQIAALGAVTGLREVTGNQLIIDIGGGSTEITQYPTLAFRGVPLGAARATAHWSTALSRRPDDRDAILRELAEAAFRTLRPTRADLSRVVAVGGTITALAAMKQGMRVFDPQRVHGTTLSTTWITETAAQLSKESLRALRERLRFDSDRARVIVAGTYLWSAVLNRLGIARVTVSARGLRWGMAVILAGLPDSPTSC
jgi:exopolyphosphatase/guanosine-5'-triphosphate,3'-diphosphate pyrophosphatase